jgi:hypothetical protein
LDTKGRIVYSLDMIQYYTSKPAKLTVMRKFTFLFCFTTCFLNCSNVKDDNCRSIEISCENNNIELITIYSDGRIPLTSFSFGNNNNLKHIVQHHNNVPAPNVSFTDSGMIQRIGERYQNNKRQGYYIVYHNNGVIKRYVYYDVFGDVRFIRDYDEFGNLTSSKGFILSKIKFIDNDSSLLLRFATPPYCNLYVKYFEHDMHEQTVSDTFYIENQNEVIYKPISFDNTMKIYVYLYDFFEKDTIKQFMISPISLNLKNKVGFSSIGYYDAR